MTAYHRFNNRVMIIATGVPKEISSYAEILPLDLRNSTVICVVKGPTSKEWMEYMQGKYPQVPADIIAFLSYFVEHGGGGEAGG